MSPAPAVIALALSATKLISAHSQRVWNNLSSEERAELFELLKPKDGKPYKKMNVRIPKKPVTFTREDGKRLPRIGKGGGGESLGIDVPVPDPTYLKDLSSEEKDRLKYLIKKANTGSS